MSNKDFRKLQNRLDEEGIVTSIQKISSKRFELYINFELVKVRKQRRSLVSTLIKKYKQYGA